MTERFKPGYVLDMAGEQQTVRHVKHEQRLHSVIGKALPCFGERDISEAARVAQEAAVFRIVHAAECCFGCDLARPGPTPPGYRSLLRLVFSRHLCGLPGNRL